MLNTEDRDNNADTILVEQGNENLTIAFAGLPLGLSEVRHDFYNQTSGHGCSKIFCKDVQLLWYQKGVDQHIHSIPELKDHLERLILDLNVNSITCIGISAGAYAALLFGYFLNADIVHAFGPQTFLSRELREEYDIEYEWWGREMDELYSQVPDTTYYDLKPILMDNTKTDFLIHICKDCDVDRKFAYHLEEVPGVRILEYDCNEHSPAAYLKRVDKLQEVLKS